MKIIDEKVNFIGLYLIISVVIHTFLLLIPIDEEQLQWTFIHEIRNIIQDLR